MVTNTSQLLELEKLLEGDTEFRSEEQRTLFLPSRLLSLTCSILIFKGRVMKSSHRTGPINKRQ